MVGYTFMMIFAGQEPNHCRKADGHLHLRRQRNEPLSTAPALLFTSLYLAGNPIELFFINLPCEFACVSVYSAGFSIPSCPYLLIRSYYTSCLRFMKNCCVQWSCSIHSLPVFQYFDREKVAGKVFDLFHCNRFPCSNWQAERNLFTSSRFRGKRC